jgi:hypothetical protein
LEVVLLLVLGIEVGHISSSLPTHWALLVVAVQIMDIQSVHSLVGLQRSSSLSALRVQMLSHIASLLAFDCLLKGMSLASSCKSSLSLVELVEVSLRLALVSGVAGMLVFEDFRQDALGGAWEV